MRHRKRVKKLGRTASHRNAMLRNLACALFEHGRIETTKAKAKALARFVARLITFGKKDTLHNRRMVISWLNNRQITKKIFEVIAPRVGGRQGGYTRIIQIGYRKGDNAPMVLIELVD